jgi:hypothetical protein
VDADGAVGRGREIDAAEKDVGGVAAQCVGGAEQVDSKARGGGAGDLVAELDAAGRGGDVEEPDGGAGRHGGDGAGGVEPAAADGDSREGGDGVDGVEEDRLDLVDGQGGVAGEHQADRAGDVGRRH